MTSEKNTRMKFDFDRITAIHHHCTGCRSGKDCCCARYDIFVSRDEMQRILDIFPLLASYCRGLSKDGAYENVFEESEDGTIRIDADENELCVFAFRRKGLIRCAIHAVAIDLGIPVEAVKPFHCLLWPLAVSPGTEDVVSVQENALDFPCNRRRRSERPCASIQETLDMLFTGRRRKKPQAEPPQPNAALLFPAQR